MDELLLWSHAITPWFDLQAGLRQDFVGHSRTHAAIGVQGLAPYFFELDAAAFLSTKGELTARVEAELDQRIIQRLIIQPRAELSLSAQDIPELGIGAGSTASRSVSASGTRSRARSPLMSALNSSGHSGRAAISRVPTARAGARRGFC